MDLVKLVSKEEINKAVLITGDSDFVPAVRMAKDDTIQIYLIHGTRIHNGKTLPLAHDELYSLCDERIPITKELLKRLT
ncbi:MAG: NYN domain-containing protein [Candidatus Paceibacterota bacterium]